MKKVSIKEIKFYNENIKMPIGILTDENGEEVGYLSPFRNYCFQVSGTFDGQMDLGSSKVIGLGNVWNAKKSRSEIGYQTNLNWYDTKKELLKGQAALAIMSFENYFGGEYKFISSNFGEKKLSNGETVWVNDDLDWFIEEVAIYLG